VVSEIAVVATAEGDPLSVSAERTAERLRRAPSPVHLVGESLGALAAGLAAALAPEAVATVTLVAPYLGAPVAARGTPSPAVVPAVPRSGRWQAFGDLVSAVHAHDGLTVLGSLSAPVLVVHGERDPIVPMSAVRLLVAGLPGTRLLSVATAGHDVLARHGDAVGAEVSAWWAAQRTSIVP
jgi:pimeloyl-ACP methyl ester carboxylesterase